MYELLTEAREREINKQLTLIDRDARKMSGDMEMRIASLGYINADYLSGMSVLSGMIGVVSLFVAIGTTELAFALKIIIGIGAAMLLVIAIGANWKFFTKDTAKQVAFTIHQHRCAEESRAEESRAEEARAGKARTDSKLLLDGMKELKDLMTIQEPDFNTVRLTKATNTKLWLSLLVVIAIAARKRRS